LTRPFDKHLDSDELDSLVSSRERSASGSEQLSEATLREAQRHVESCQNCSRKLQRHQFVQREISRMRVPNSSPPGADCMGDAEWLKVAAGLLPEAKIRERMNHAAQCGHCGPLLKNAAEALVSEVTPDEEALLDSLPSARPEWRKNMAAMLRGSVQTAHRKTSWWNAIFVWPTPAYGLAGVVAVGLFVWIGIRVLTPASADQLLAQAYTERRTVEVRIPGAKHAPMRVERSVGGSNFDKPAALLKAEGIISEKLRQSPNDVASLDAKARAELLDGNDDTAIKTLQHALESQPDSPELLTDLGSAYYQRARSSDQPIDYGNAIEALGKALSKSPDNPVALFNRALACEQMFLYTQAIDDWQHYLRLDPQGGWADEARQHLQAIRNKVDQHTRSMAEPLLTPDFITSSRVRAEVLQARIDARIEDYLKIATTDWLPAAYSRRTEESRADRDALNTLARITLDRHQDAWLSDLLTKTDSREFRLGVDSLAKAILANEGGDYVEGRQSAHRAVLMFELASNRAGRLRAFEEELYADQLLYDGNGCRSILRQLKLPLKGSAYPWLQAQTDLEESNCSNINGDLGNYESVISKGTQAARDHGYMALFLRGMGFQAQSTSSLGDQRTGFSLATKGLELFWSGTIDLIKGYNLYTDLDTAADELRLPGFQVVLWREATALVDLYPDLLQRAMAHRWYANAAYLADRPTLAETEFAKARDLFARSPQTEATARRLMDAEIWLAELETRRGDLDQASARLEKMKQLVDATPSFVQNIRYYDTLAKIALKRGEVGTAESALRPAVFLAESALNSFHGEGGRKDWADEAGQVYRTLVQWKLQQGADAPALELWQWYRGAELRSSETQRPSLDLPSPLAVANRLPLLRAQTVVTYAIFDDGIEVWVYDDRGIYSHWISTPPAVVEAQADQFLRLCSDPVSDLTTLRKKASELYNVLLLPIQGKLAPERLLVLDPDGFLKKIPWVALVDPEQRYVAERTSVAVMPGLYRAGRLRTPVNIFADAAALIVDVPTIPDGGLAPLVDADSEAQTVADQFSSAHRLQGSAATLSAIKKELEVASVFHFVGHAVDTPLGHGLALAEKDLRTGRPRAIERLETKQTANLQLVVLSACQTAAESNIGSSGTESLAESLLRGGVPRIVVARWNINSAQTVKLMNSFYAHFLNGNDAASALRYASLAVAAQPQYAHPYYWAAFELVGSI